jgi:hypothetical protein
MCTSTQRTLGNIGTSKGLFDDVMCAISPFSSSVGHYWVIVFIKAPPHLQPPHIFIVLVETFQGPSKAATGLMVCIIYHNVASCNTPFANARGACMSQSTIAPVG